MVNNSKKTKEEVNKPAPRRKKVDLRTRPLGEHADTVLMQIKDEIDKNFFNTNDTNDKILKLTRHVVLITEQVYAGTLEIFSLQKLGHLVGISRDYLYELSVSHHSNAKYLKAAINNFKLAVADNLITNGMKKVFSESLTKHYLPYFDTSKYDHEKTMALLKQLETPTTPISVILNKPAVTSKQCSGGIDPEPDGGF